MRLTNDEIKAIKDTFCEVFEDGDIYLFGSRVDDSKKGGDIDLYISPANELDDLHQKKIDFLVKLDFAIGEQKIDVIISKDKARLIEQEALRTGVKI